MSNGFRDAIRDFWRASEQADQDPWDDEELTEVIEYLNKNGMPKEPWLDFSGWAPKEYKCDCGAAKAGTTHIDWCSTRRV